MKLTSRHFALPVSESNDKFRKYTKLSTGMLCILVLQDCQRQLLFCSSSSLDFMTHRGVLQNRQKSLHERLDKIQGRRDRRDHCQHPSSDSLQVLIVIQVAQLEYLWSGSSALILTVTQKAAHKIGMM
jgi:hypothetical protein